MLASKGIQVSSFIDEKIGVHIIIPDKPPSIPLVVSPAELTYSSALEQLAPNPECSQDSELADLLKYFSFTHKEEELDLCAIHKSLLSELATLRSRELLIEKDFEPPHELQISVFSAIGVYDFPKVSDYSPIEDLIKMAEQEIQKLKKICDEREKYT